MSTNNLEDKLIKNVGVLNNIKSNNSSNIKSNTKDNMNVMGNTNIKNNINSNNDVNINDNRNINVDNNDDIIIDINDKVQAFKNIGGKRIIKNTTLGLYKDQMSDVKKIAKALDMTATEFMRQSVDMVIDIFKKDLDIK